MGVIVDILSLASVAMSTDVVGAEGSANQLYELRLRMP